MTRYTRIGLTGANGTIGRVLLAGWELSTNSRHSRAAWSIFPPL